MIRTAILAGLLLVMFSMAYSRSMLPGFGAEQGAPQAPATAAATPVPQPDPMPRAKPAAVAEKPMSPVHRTATVRENLLPPERPAHAASTTLVPAPVEAEIAKPEPIAPAPVKPEPIAPASIDPTPVTVSQPTQASAPAPKAEEKPMQLAPAVAVDDMPVRDVATPKVMIPHELPLPSEGAVTSRESRWPDAPENEDVSASAGTFPSSFPSAPPSAAPARKPTATLAKSDSAPQLMSPQERTQELYRLAREMEDTFISKLAH